MIPQGIGEGGAGFDLGLDWENNLLECRVVELGSENVEALHQRQARVDHRCELTGENQQILATHPTGAGDLEAELEWPFLDLGWIETHRAKAVVHRLDVVGLHFSLLQLPSLGFGLPLPMENARLLWRWRLLHCGWCPNCHLVSLLRIGRASLPPTA